MNNLDFFNLIQNSEASSTGAAFGLTDERMDEMEEAFVKGMHAMGAAIEQGVKVTKTDMFLFIAREGFVPQSPQELVFITLMVAEKLAKNDTYGRLQQIMPESVFKGLIMILEGGKPGGEKCDCPKCKAKRLENGDLSDLLGGGDDEE